MSRFHSPIPLAAVLALSSFLTLSVEPLSAQSTDGPTPSLDKAALQAGAQLTHLGVTRRNTPIPVLVTNKLLDVTAPVQRVVVVLDPSVPPHDRSRILQEWTEFATAKEFQAARDSNTFGLVPALLPDGDRPDAWKFPPSGTAYSDEAQPEALYLWRWLGMAAPDTVVVVSHEDSLHWDLEPTAEISSLAAALRSADVAQVGSIRAVHVTLPANGHLFRSYLEQADRIQKLPAGTAPAVMARRRNRGPIDVARELSKVYGHKLPAVAYIPSLALMGRVRLGQLTNDPSHLEDVERIVAPYLSGEQDSLGSRTSGSTLSGHLVFGELADRTGVPNYSQLVCKAADLGFDKDGQPLEAMPFHLEMSDSVFMGTPILVQAGRLTGDTRYFEMAARHLAFMLKLNLRPDGLHQHSPVDPQHTAWGRGNGFPALGLALSLSDLPEDSPHRPEMLKQFRNHLAAMLQHQDEMGMWHQVVDHPESYREFTVTCMTTFAITRGLRRGWLDRKTFEPVVLRAWESIKSRVGPEGNLVDVCTGTGKQKDLRGYFDRTAILGRDDRGGAMALMVSTELAYAQREGVVELPSQP